MSSGCQPIARALYASDDSWSSIRTVFKSFARENLRVRSLKYQDIERVDKDNFDVLMSRWLDRLGYTEYPKNIIMWASV
jgi:hypothetical protein